MISFRVSVVMMMSVDKLSFFIIIKTVSTSVSLFKDKFYFIFPYDYKLPKFLFYYVRSKLWFPIENVVIFILKVAITIFVSPNRKLIL